jgi:hypothetical protein
MKDSALGVSSNCRVPYRSAPLVGISYPKRINEVPCITLLSVMFDWGRVLLIILSPDWPTKRKSGNDCLPCRFSLRTAPEVSTAQC